VTDCASDIVEWREPELITFLKIYERLNTPSRRKPANHGFTGESESEHADPGELRNRTISDHDCRCVTNHRLNRVVQTGCVIRSIGVSRAESGAIREDTNGRAEAVPNRKSRAFDGTEPEIPGVRRCRTGTRNVRRHRSVAAGTRKDFASHGRSTPHMVSGGRSRDGTERARRDLRGRRVSQR